MIGAPVPGVVNALQVTIPGRSPSVPIVKALGNARDEKSQNFEKLYKISPKIQTILYHIFLEYACYCLFIGATLF